MALAVSHLQTGSPIDCTQGGCNGADSSCFGGICAVCRTGHLFPRHPIPHTNLRSPLGAQGGRNGYSDNLDCGKHIHAPASNTIELTFTYIALETGSLCPEPGEHCTTATARARALSLSGVGAD
jgi:hypothetical protein